MGDMECVVVVEADIEEGRTSYFIYILLGVGCWWRSLARVYRFVGILSFLSFRDVFMSFRWEIMHASCTTMRTINKFAEAASGASVCGGKIMLYYCRNMLFISIRWRFVSDESSFPLSSCSFGPVKRRYWFISAEFNSFYRFSIGLATIECETKFDTTSSQADDDFEWIS